MDEESARHLVHILAWSERLQLMLTSALCVLLLIACVLLVLNHARLGALHQELQTRNRQGAASLALLTEAVTALKR